MEFNVVHTQKSLHINLDPAASSRATRPVPRAPLESHQVVLDGLAGSSSVAAAMTATFAATDLLLSEMKARSRENLRSTKLRASNGVSLPVPSERQSLINSRSNPEFHSKPITASSGSLRSRPRVSKISAAVRDVDRAVAELTRQPDASEAARLDLVPLFQCSCRRFRVGKATSQTNSRVQVFRDRVEYHFQHPMHRAKIHMVMFYKDMVGARLEGTTLWFRINKLLNQFTSDYDFQDSAHRLSIKFDSQQDADAFRDLAFESLQKLSSGR